MAERTCSHCLQESCSIVNSYGKESLQTKLSDPWKESGRLPGAFLSSRLFQQRSTAAPLTGPAEACVWISESEAPVSIKNAVVSLQSFCKLALLSPGILEKNTPGSVDALWRSLQR